MATMMKFKKPVLQQRFLRLLYRKELLLINDSLLIEGAGALSKVEGIPASSTKRKKKKSKKNKRSKNLTKSEKMDKYSGGDVVEVGKEPSTRKKKKCSSNKKEKDKKKLRERRPPSKLW